MDPTREPLDPDEVRERMGALADWSYQADALHRTYELGSFRAAIELIDRIADVAEELDHHPDLRNRYRTLEVRLTTHDVGGVTSRDLDLAERIERLARA